VLTATFVDNFETAGDNGWTHASWATRATPRTTGSAERRPDAAARSMGVPGPIPPPRRARRAAGRTTSASRGGRPQGATARTCTTTCARPAINLAGKWARACASSAG
jgi:hypothetical protein